MPRLLIHSPVIEQRLRSAGEDPDNPVSPAQVWTMLTEFGLEEQPDGTWRCDENALKLLEPDEYQRLD